MNAKMLALAAQMADVSRVCGFGKITRSLRASVSMLALYVDVSEVHAVQQVEYYRRVR